MADKQLSHIMLQKLTQRTDYFAWYLSQYQQSENVSPTDIANLLQVSHEQIEVLSMCKVPDSRQSDFPKRLKAIADFAQINHFVLATLIRKVEAVIALQAGNKTEAASLMAAREKDKEK